MQLQNQVDFEERIPVLIILEIALNWEIRVESLPISNHGWQDSDISAVAFAQGNANSLERVAGGNMPSMIHAFQGFTLTLTSSTWGIVVGIGIVLTVMALIRKSLMAVLVRLLISYRSLA